jgi:anion-transporting  ArsA/GET3 family ATPase
MRQAMGPKDSLLAERTGVVPDILSRRLLVVAGKGGVGKSTVSAVLAWLAARLGKRVLLAQAGGAERIGGFFGVAPVGTEITQVAENLHAVYLQADAALEEYATSVLHSRFLYRLVFGNRRVRALLGALPGLPELLIIGKVRFHVEEGSRGAGWDLIILDTPPTGAGVFLLELPQALIDVIELGPIAHFARRQRDLLADRERTSIQLVTLAEEMPVRETIEIAKTLGGRLGFPLGCVFVNRVHPPLLDPREQEPYRLLEAIAPSVDHRARPLFHAARDEIDRYRIQEQHLAVLGRALDLPRIDLPALPTERLGLKEIECLAQAVARALFGATK